MVVLNFGEEPKSALIRELKEELNATKITVDKLVDVLNICQVQHDKSSYQYIVLVFNCDLDLSELKLSDEHTEYDWINPAQFAELPMKKPYREFFAQNAQG
ncbi:MAG: NUDIX domain-containing protein [Patescibacteria group bacterium]